MATHEFGIMPAAPILGQRYDSYEPERYCCISVEDELVEPLAAATADADVYWHTLDRPGKGLAYCGITLIPPEALEDFLRNLPSSTPLAALLRQAHTEGLFVIHFGL